MLFKNITTKWKRKYSYGNRKYWIPKGWSGTYSDYTKLHLLIRKRLVKPCACFMCQDRVPDDLHNISGKYYKRLSDWVYLYRKCHSNVHRNQGFKEAFLLKFNKGSANV